MPAREQTSSFRLVGEQDPEKVRNGIRSWERILDALSQA